MRVVAFASLLLMSCASTLRAMGGHMDADAAAKYASLAPEEFVKTRFYTEEFSVLDHVSDGLDKLGAKGSRGKPPSHPAISGDGRIVILNAYYNNINYHQLTRPAQNLQTYCEAVRHGQWRPLHPHPGGVLQSVDYVATVYTKEQIETIWALGKRNHYAGMAPSKELASGDAFLPSLLELNEDTYYWPGFDKAVHEGAFGVFQCADPAGAWSISVVPQWFFAKDSSLETATALLVISPYSLN